MFFWNFLFFSMIQRILAIWSLDLPRFLNAARTFGNSRFVYCWSLAWRIWSTTLLACEVNAAVQQSARSLALPFFGTKEIAGETVGSHLASEGWISGLTFKENLSCCTRICFPFLWTVTKGNPFCRVQVLIIFFTSSVLFVNYGKKNRLFFSEIKSLKSL